SLERHQFAMPLPGMSSLGLATHLSGIGDWVSRSCGLAVPACLRDVYRDWIGQRAPTEWRRSLLQSLGTRTKSPLTRLNSALQASRSVACAALAWTMR